MISPDDIQIRVRPHDDFTQELHAYVERHATVVIEDEELDKPFPVLGEITKAAKRSIMSQLYGDIHRKVTQIYIDCSRKLAFLSDGDSHKILTNLEELRHTVDPSRSDPIKKELEFVPSKHMIWVQSQDGITVGKLDNWYTGHWNFYPYNINFPLSETMLMEITQALTSLNSGIEI